MTTPYIKQEESDFDDETSRNSFDSTLFHLALSVEPETDLVSPAPKRGQTSARSDQNDELTEGLDLSDEIKYESSLERDFEGRVDKKGVKNGAETSPSEALDQNLDGTDEYLNQEMSEDSEEEILTRKRGRISTESGLDSQNMEVKQEEVSPKPSKRRRISPTPVMERESSNTEVKLESESQLSDEIQSESDENSEISEEDIKEEETDGFSESSYIESGDSDISDEEGSKRATPEVKEESSVMKEESDEEEQQQEQQHKQKENEQNEEVEHQQYYSQLEEQLERQLESQLENVGIHLEDQLQNLLSNSDDEISETPLPSDESSESEAETLPQPIIITTSEGTKYNKRVFKGNPNYVAFFNREVDAFFSNDNYLPPYRTRLTQSKVGHDRMIYRLSLLGKYLDHEIKAIYEEGTPGTIWTSEEKEKFFNALARYSIHNFDEIRNRLPEKSDIEIMNYYNLLKFELNHLKQKSKRVKYKISIDNSKHKFFRRLRAFRKSIKIDNIPAAYEMSEEFINFEEVQANLINKRETILQTDNNRFYKKSFETYTKDTEHNLINVEGCTELSEKIYVKNNLFDDEAHNPFVTPGAKLVPTLNLKSLVTLEELIKLVTENILLTLIESKTRQFFMGITTSGLSIPKEFGVTKRDVTDAVKLLRLFQAPKSGSVSSGNDGKCGKMKYYWNNLADSLNLTNQNAQNKQPILRSKEFNDITPQFRITDDFLLDPVPGSGNGYVHPISITELNENKEEKHNLRDDHIELKLIELESQRLEANDSLQSRKYEYVLLTLLLTFDENEEAVQRSMFTEEEIMNLVLTGWFDVTKLASQPSQAALSDSASHSLRHIDVEDSDPSDDDSDEGDVNRAVPQEPIKIRTTPWYEVEVDEVVTATFASNFGVYGHGIV